MRNLLRKPLPWMVLAECAVVAALAMVAWHMVASPPVRAASAPTSASTPSASADDGGQVSPDQVTPAKPQASAAPPGLNVDATFWRLRLGELNRGEAEFEALEWRIVHSAMATARRYIQTVVLPAITSAERSGEQPDRGTPHLWGVRTRRSVAVRGRGSRPSPVSW